MNESLYQMSGTVFSFSYFGLLGCITLAFVIVAARVVLHRPALMVLLKYVAIAGLLSVLALGLSFVVAVLTWPMGPA
jgi:hypothetical protein